MSLPPELRSTLAFEELVIVFIGLISERLNITDHEIASAIKQFVSCRAEKRDE